MIEPRYGGVLELSRALTFSTESEKMRALGIVFQDPLAVIIQHIEIPFIIGIENDAVTEHIIFISLDLAY